MITFFFYSINRKLIPILVREVDAAVTNGDSFDCRKQTVGRNVDVKSTPGDGLERGKRPVTGNWRREGPCHIVAGSLAELHAAFL